MFLPPPPANGGPDLTLCLGNTHMFYLPPGYTYAWTPPDFLDDPTSNSPTTSPDVVGTTQYIIAVSDAFGCTSYDTVIVTASFRSSGFRRARYTHLSGWRCTIICIRRGNLRMVFHLMGLVIQRSAIQQQQQKFQLHIM